MGEVLGSRLYDLSPTPDPSLTMPWTNFKPPNWKGFPYVYPQQNGDRIRYQTFVRFNQEQIFLGNFSSVSDALFAQEEFLRDLGKDPLKWRRDARRRWKRRDLVRELEKKVLEHRRLVGSNPEAPPNKSKPRTIESLFEALDGKGKSHD